MVGGDENLVVMNEWAAPSPSPRSFFSSLLKDGISAISCSNIAQDNRKQWPPSVAYEQKAATSMDEEGNENGSEGFGAGDSLSETKVPSVQKPSSRSSFSERMATRGGFNTPSLNITKVSVLSSSHPDVRSSYLTTPSLSPTTLLDSPVFLSNSLTQQSPTTGKISSELFGGKPFRSASLSEDQSYQDINAVSFAFNPHPGSNTSCFPSRPQAHRTIAQLAVNGHQPRPSIEVSVLPLRPAASQNLEVTNNQQQELQPCHLLSDDIKKNNGNVSKSTEVASDETEIKIPPVEKEDMRDDYRGDYYSTLVEAPSEDGYNWRKYGQKQVKGREFPRSYYKCTHPNCPVKKKVERSQEGHITEIIYKGAHNHSKPQACRRSATGSSSHPFGDQQQSMWAPGEAPSSALASGFCDQLATIADEGVSREKVHAGIDVSSAESIDEEEDECVSQRGQDDEDDSESKRRKLDSCVTEMSGSSRSIREPRVVVQTTSEVDILDDGYRWRKYGQKVVKGNPNPRSYYKCTNAGCNVRKHVERASHDLKSVITTYEGKHNHDVPAAKNNSHVNSSSSMSSVSSAPFVSRPAPSLPHQEIPRFANPLLRRQTLGSPGSSFPVGQQGFSNLAMGCLGSATQSKVPSMQMHQSFYDNQGKGNVLGLMMPKEEPKEPATYTSNIPLGSSIYHQLMSRLPL